MPRRLASRQHRLASRGQATVEFALLLPVLLCVTCLLLDIAWLAVDQCRVNDASRAAVRAVIVDSHNASDVGTRIARQILGESTDVDVLEADGLATVQVSRPHDFITPLIGRLLPRVHVRASSTMLIEPETRNIGFP